MFGHRMWNRPNKHAVKTKALHDGVEPESEPLLAVLLQGCHIA